MTLRFQRGYRHGEEPAGRQLASNQYMDRNNVIQVVSDVVCPWCFIGKRRLEKALGLLGRKDVEVQWSPFQLNPGAPKDGWNRRAYRAAKFGGIEVADRLQDRV